MTKIPYHIPVPDFIMRICVWFLLRYRKRRYGYPFRKIKLTKGQYAIVDPEDYDKLNSYNWYAKFNGYTYYAERKERIYGPSTVRRCSPQARLRAGPSTVQRCSPQARLRAGPSTRLRAGIKRSIRMHRQIMRAPPFGCAQDGQDKVVDHKNHHGWDNRKENLQVVSQQENNWNSERGKNSGSSKYKGVNYDKAHKKYRATLCLNSGKIHLGYFENEIDAAKAYDEASKRYRGKFAILNFTTEDTEKHRGIYNKKILHHEEQKKHEETK